MDITCVGSSAKEDEDTHEDLKTMHMKRLCRIPVKNFIEKMRSEDIKATDGGDKDEQLKMLDGFADTMTTFQEASGVQGTRATCANVVVHDVTNGRGSGTFLRCARCCWWQDEISEGGAAMITCRFLCVNTLTSRKKAQDRTRGLTFLE